MVIIFNVNFSLLECGVEFGKKLMNRFFWVVVMLGMLLLMLYMEFDNLGLVLLFFKLNKLEYFLNINIKIFKLLNIII